MEAVIEKSQYEIERGKPMPSKNHAYIQSKIIKVIFKKYDDDFEVLSELSLNINGRDKIPDLAIYKEIDYTPGEDEIRVSQLPLAVVEILSPKQTITDLIIKSNDYFVSDIKKTRFYALGIYNNVIPVAKNTKSPNDMKWEIFEYLVINIID